MLTAPALLAGCATGPVDIDTPAGAEKVRPACERFLDALPDRVLDQPRREVEPDDALGRAWGRPAITVTCGVPAAGALAVGPTCIKASGVDWYAPEEQTGDPDADAVLTLVGRTPRISVEVPGDYRTDEPTSVGDVLTDLAGPVKATLRRTSGCSLDPVPVPGSAP